MKKEKYLTSGELTTWMEKNIDDYEKKMEEARLELNLEVRIREMRKNQKLSQADLAKRMNTRQGSVSRFEKDISNVKLETLIKLASALGKTLEITFKDMAVVE